LFKEWFQAKFFPPKLVLELVDPRLSRQVSAYLVATNPAGQQIRFQTVGRWFHVKVHNECRMTPATEVQVYLIEVGIPNAAGQYVSYSPGAIPFVVRHEGKVQRALGPDLEWDLCNIVRESVPGNAPAVALCTLFAPTDVIITPNQPFKMTLTLQAQSKEVDSERLLIELIWNGRFAEDTDELMNNLVIRTVN
jgi:hypothetical protein